MGDIPGQAKTALRRPHRATRNRVRDLFAEGTTVCEIARCLGVTPSAVCYHARRLGVPPSRKYAPREDWHEIQRNYDAGHSLRECQEKFGFSRRSWGKAVTRGDLVPRPQAIPLNQLLVPGRVRSRGHIKLRLVRSGLKEGRCEECGLSEWLGAPLSMSLHHVNGERTDNRLDNLRLLCASCHSQTANFARNSSAT
jgi:hypothetical protein